MRIVVLFWKWQIKKNDDDDDDDNYIGTKIFSYFMQSRNN